MVKISAISYLNTIPFIFGLKNSNLASEIDFHFDYPANCAESFINKKSDIALIPVASLKHLKNYHIISNYCIGANREVDTVCLYSDVDINDVKEIYLDYQSRTSVELLKILLREYWKVDPKLVLGIKDYENNINKSSAGLVIGDRAFKLNGKFKYSYDLSEIWYRMTNLPFVFACWVSREKMSGLFLNNFNKALAYGLNNIKLAIDEQARAYSKGNDPLSYLNDKISYDFNTDKQKALSLFLSKII